MKKVFCLATGFCILAGCYTPLNNSGVATTKAWLDIPAKKVDFEGKQYDSCYQFRLRFAPAEAAAQLDGQDVCLDRCCWRSEREEVVLDFNKNFEKNLAYYGRAEEYTPGKITLKVTHSGLLNTTAVKVSPRGAVSPNGLVKLKSKTVENPARLAQIENEARKLQARRNAWLADQQIDELTPSAPYEDPAAQQRAQELVQRKEGTRIDRYFYTLNKSYQQKGYVFLISQRIYSARAWGENVYRVACRAKVQSGARAGSLKNRNISCGVWKADLAAGTVAPADATARKIKTQI